MTKTDELLEQLQRFADDDATILSEPVYRRLMLVTMARLYSDVSLLKDKMMGNGKPGLEQRLSRLEWIVGIGVAVASVIGSAVLAGLATGSLRISVP
jgi:hypothetical protein